MNTNNPKKLLFITAHPDDETISAGTLILARNKGWRNYVYHLTPGKNGKLNAGETEEVVLSNRAQEARLFATGVNGECSIHDSNKTILSSDDATITQLVQYIRTIRPSVIILLHSDDYHFEHRVSRDISLVAIEIAARSSMTHLGLKITDFIILETDGLCPLPTVTMTIDVSSVLTEKESLVSSSYGQRLGDYLLNYDRGLSVMRGERLGFSAGESYRLVTPPFYQLSSKRAQILCEFIDLDKSNPI